MEINKNEVTLLIQDWRKLNGQVAKRQNPDVELFKKSFSKTFSLLSQCAGAESVDKSYIELISVVYLFANSEDSGVDTRRLAMCVLTERMLNTCAFNSTTESLETASVYILKSREEVVLNFNNVSESINILEKILERDYWNSL